MQIRYDGPTENTQQLGKVLVRETKENRSWLKQSKL